MLPLELQAWPQGGATIHRQDRSDGRTTRKETTYPRAARSRQAGTQSPATQFDALFELQRQAGNGAVQRFMAVGPVTHETLEEPALEGAGFDKRQVQAIDFGNWMRDLSQLMTHPVTTWQGRAVFELLSLLARGLFDRDLDPNELGGYLPSEHLDNPEGGTSAEKNLDSLPVFGNDRKPLPQAKPDVAPLTAEQRLWLEKEQEPAIESTIDNLSARSGLPSYIERGKVHAKMELEIALRGGPSDERGLRALGNALHTIQDYYSHSNFVDVGLTMLHRAGQVPDDTWMRLANFWINERGLSLETIGVLPRRGGTIVTGTFPPGPTSDVSMWESVQRALETGGALRNALLRGWLYKHGPHRLPEVFAATTAVLGTASLAIGYAEKKTNEKTREVVASANRHTPSHAQLAKDDPDHPLIAPAGALAAWVTNRIGTTVQQSWRSPGSRTSVAQLVDTYLSQPSDSMDWWSPTIVGQMGRVHQALVALNIRPITEAQLELMQQPIPAR